MLIVVMGIKIQVSVCMGGLSVNINSDDSIFPGDKSVEEGDLSVTFGLDGK